MHSDNLFKLMYFIEGKPPPTLYWYRDNNILNDFKSFVHDNSIVENELILKNVKRTDHNVNFTCQAFNNHSSSLLSVSITLDIYGGFC